MVMSPMHEEAPSRRRIADAHQQGVEMTSMAGPVRRPAMSSFDIEAPPAPKAPSMWDRFTSGASDAWKTVKSGASSLWGGITSAASNAWSAIKPHAKTAANAGADLGLKTLGFRSKRSNDEYSKQLAAKRAAVPLHSDAAKAARVAHDGAVETQKGLEDPALTMGGMASSLLIGANVHQGAMNAAGMTEAASRKIMATDQGVQDMHAQATAKNDANVAASNAIFEARKLASEQGKSPEFQRKLLLRQRASALKHMASNHQKTLAADIAQVPVKQGMTGTQSAAILKDGGDKRLEAGPQETLGGRAAQKIRSGAEVTAMAADVVGGNNQDKYLNAGDDNMALAVGASNLAHQGLAAAQVTRPVNSLVRYGAMGTSALAGGVKWAANKAAQTQDQHDLQHSWDSGAWHEEAAKGVRIKPTWQE